MADEMRPLGPMLDRFATFHHMEVAGLARFLGIGVERLPGLRDATLPEEREEMFVAQAEHVAAASGASAARLMQVARVAKILR